MQDVIRNLHNSFKTRKLTIPQDLCYLQGQFREDYLHDMDICQRWAQINRKLIVNLIMDFIVGKGVVSFEEHFQSFESVHNYSCPSDEHELPNSSPPDGQLRYTSS